MTGAMVRENWTRSLVLFPGALGDFICLLPALERVGRSSWIDLLARTEFADLAPSNVTVRSVECYEIRRLFVRGGADDERLKNFFASYASVYSWMGSAVTDFANQLMSLTQGRARLFPFRPLHGGMHQCDYYLSCVENSPPAAIPCVSLKPDAVAWCDAFWDQHALLYKPVLALAPGSGARQKNWPISCFTVIAQWWREYAAGAVIAIVGPVEEELEEYDILYRDSLPARNLSLAQLAALLSRCDLYLGNDSGVTHLAGAVGTRGAAIFGPSDASQWAPSGDKIVTLTRKEECSPCTLSTMRNCLHRRCLTALEPAAVISELQRLSAVASLTRWGTGITVEP